MNELSGMDNNMFLAIVEGKTLARGPPLLGAEASPRHARIERRARPALRNPGAGAMEGAGVIQFTPYRECLSARLSDPLAARARNVAPLGAFIRRRARA